MPRSPKEGKDLRPGLVIRLVQSDTNDLVDVARALEMPWAKALSQSEELGQGLRLLVIEILGMLAAASESKALPPAIGSLRSAALQVQESLGRLANRDLTAVATKKETELVWLPLKSEERARLRDVARTMNWGDGQTALECLHAAYCLGQKKPIQELPRVVKLTAALTCFAGGPAEKAILHKINQRRRKSAT